MARDTKEKILESAHLLFEEKGFNGVTMREISAKSGINKGLLHYYFKSKQAIFLGVFRQVIKYVFLNVSEILERKDIDFDTKVDLLVDQYILLLSKHPKLPLFVLSELGKLPDFVEGTQIALTLKKAATLLEENLKEVKKVEPGEGFHFLMSLASLCVFPFVASPIIDIIKPKDFKSHADFMESRKVYIKSILKKSYR